MEPNLEVTVGRVKLNNPVMNASGCFGLEYGEIEDFDLNALGGIVNKSVKPLPVVGNPPPRIAEVDGGMLNSIGLEGPGIDKFIDEELLNYLALGIPVIVSIAGGTMDDYLMQAEKLDKIKDIAAIEVNVSCPNVDTGLAYGVESELVYGLISKVRQATSHPLWVKLTPNVSDMVPMARAAYRAGAEALVIANTLRGMKIDIKKQKPEFARKYAGMSGPKIMPVNVAFVYDVYAAIGDRVSIVGVGGIKDASDAMEYILAGASAVQIGTYNFADPLAIPRAVEGIKDYMKGMKVEKFSELIGKAHR
ncbi:MAG: dihydroorotate dehydrogenase [Nanoarchaeota archaeon]|nr:dihydroorotate dehydrogenase [Nanoarchaeota archaeon]